MRSTTEAFARVRIDALATDSTWSLTDRVGVLCKHALYVGAQANYVFCDRPSHLPGTIRVKRAGIGAIAAREQGHRYAEQLNVPFVVLSHAEDVSVLDRQTGVHARKLAGFRSQPQRCP